MNEVAAAWGEDWGDQEWKEEAEKAADEAEGEGAVLDFDDLDLSDVWAVETTGVNVVDGEDEWFVNGRDPWGGKGRDPVGNSVDEEVSMFDRGKAIAGKLIEIPDDVSMFDVGKEPEKPSERFSDFAFPDESPPEPKTPDRKIGTSTEFMEIHSPPISTSSATSHESALSPDFVRKFYDSSPARASPESTPSTSSSTPASSTVLDKDFLRKVNLGIPKEWEQVKVEVENDKNNSEGYWQNSDWDDHAMAFLEVEMGESAVVAKPDGKGMILIEELPDVDIKATVEDFERKFDKEKREAEEAGEEPPPPPLPQAGHSRKERMRKLAYRPPNKKLNVCTGPCADVGCQDLECQKSTTGIIGEQKGVLDREPEINNELAITIAREQARKVRMQERKIARTKEVLEKEVREAFAAGGELEVWTRLAVEKPPGFSKEDDFMEILLDEMGGKTHGEEDFKECDAIVFNLCTVCDSSGHLFGDMCPACDNDPTTVPSQEQDGVSSESPFELMCMADDAGKAKELDDKKREWRRLRVAMDSGANVDVMPESACDQLPVLACTGPWQGKPLAAANGTVIETSGEKRIQGLTDSGDAVDWRFIAGNVKKALKSTATTCDDEKWVIHTKSGGWIIDVASKRRIAMVREGNSYIVDVWVRVPKSPGFTRPSAR